nr:unnamed protein product [Callosobruchus chinensis]
MSITERLIEKVKEYPILYDLGHEDYKNVRKKDKIWDEIGTKLNEDGEQLKKKWKNLRDSFAKHLKSLKTKTGQSAVKNTYKKWQWAEQMQHFRPFLIFATTSTNIEYIDNSPITSESENTQTEVQSSLLEEHETTQSVLNEESEPTKQIEPKNKKKKKEKQNIDEEGSSVKTVLEYIENKKESRKDPIDLIFEGYAQMLKQFSPRRQAETKLKIAHIMNEQELKHQEDLAYKNHCAYKLQRYNPSM